MTATSLAGSATGTRPSPNRRRRGDLRRRLVGLAFTSPALVFVALLLAYPLGYIAWLSFHEYAPLRSREKPFVGLENFQWLAGDDLATKSLAVTLVFTVCSVALEMVFGTFCAVLLGQLLMGVRGRAGRVVSKVMSSTFILPFAVPAVAGAFAWRMLLDTQFGPVNAVLGTETTWLVDHALASVVVIDAWKMTPFVVFVLLAGVMSVEPSQYEAAQIDGAGRWRQFFAITLPSIIPVFLVTAAFRAVDAFTKVFDTVFATTGGGPGTDTQVFPLLIWKVAFTNLDYGKAAALAVVAIAISLVFGGALLYSRRSGRV